METGADSETGLCLHLPLRARFIDRLRIGYCNKNTIYVIDQEDSYMTASYSKGRIILLYNVNNQISSEVIPLKKTQLGYIAS